MSGILASSTAVQGQGVSLSGQKIPAMNAAVPSSPAEGVAVPSGGGGDGFCNIKDRGPAGLSPLCTRLRQKRSSGRFRGEFSARPRVERGGSRSSSGEKTRGENTRRGGGDSDAVLGSQSPESGAMLLTASDPERTWRVHGDGHVELIKRWTAGCRRCCESKTGISSGQSFELDSEGLRRALELLGQDVRRAYLTNRVPVPPIPPAFGPTPLGTGTSLPS